MVGLLNALFSSQADLSCSQPTKEVPLDTSRLCQRTKKVQLDIEGFCENLNYIYNLCLFGRGTYGRATGTENPLSV